MSFFKVSDISSGYNKKNVIRNISFEMDKGEIVGILGLNGSGKTTLLKACCNLLTHTGQCEVEGEVLEQCSSKKVASLCSYLPQKSGISIDITVLEVVLMGFNPELGLLQYPTVAMKKRAMEEIEKVGLAGLENKNYMELSEGQKRLCIFARTLVTDSKMLFLDEPDSSLDLRIRYQLFERLKKMAALKECAILTTLHDINLALQYCDRILILESGEIISNICIRETSVKELEKNLARIFGANKILECDTIDNRIKYVLVKEPD